MDWTNDLLTLGKITLSVCMGGLIGYERELADKPAGLRTHMLVAAAATLIVSLGDVLVANFQTNEQITSDPIRLIEAVIVGVSFLGTGTILHREKDLRVHGLTTAASLLFTAGIGIAVAADQFILALGSVLITLLITSGVGALWSRRHTLPSTPGAPPAVE
jgi:putative Mg2+ transporter-C (MgtC) family protein